MHSERGHPILQQTYLSVSPFIDLPKPPTLPPNYASLPVTLPQSILNAAPTASAPDLPAYVVTATGGFSAHPSIIAAQNRALLEQLEKQRQDGTKEVEAWEESIRERELQERRRTAPGWLDREEKLLVPEKKGGEEQKLASGQPQRSILDDDGAREEMNVREKEVEDLGTALDRAFGRSEMG